MTVYQATHIGSNGTPTEPAGDGVTLATAWPGTSFTSTAVALGGQGFYKYNYFSPNNGEGGAGLQVLGGGWVTNAGHITGGNGGGGFYAIYNESAGGTGVIFAGGPAILDNQSVITGGAGGMAASPNFYGTTAYYEPFVTNNRCGNGGIGVEMKSLASIVNAGTIAGGAGGVSFLTNGGSGGIGAKLDAGGIVKNAGLITGGYGGLGSGEFIYYGPAYPRQYMGIGIHRIIYASGGDGGTAVEVSGRGGVVNTGTIVGGEGGTSYGNSVPTGNGGDGVVLTNGATLLNHSDGLITGGRAYGLGGTAVVLQGGTIVDTNYGTIIGGFGDDGDGIDMTTAGTFYNAGIIRGGREGGYGAYLAGGSTLINSGSIAGYGSAVKFGAAGGSRLVLTGTAHITAGYGSRDPGYVVAGGTGNVLELKGKSAVLSDVAAAITGFQTLQVDAKSNWTVSGTFASAVNAGTIDIAAGQSLDITTLDPGSTGLFVLTGRSALEISTALGIHASIEFLGSASDSLLTIGQPAEFGQNIGSPLTYAGPTLEDFSTGDTIDLKGIGSTGLGTKYDSSNGVLQVTTGSGGVVAALDFQTSSLGDGSFHLTTDDAGGSLLTRG